LTERVHFIIFLTQFITTCPTLSLANFGSLSRIKGLYAEEDRDDLPSLAWLVKIQLPFMVSLR
jgi:hypothetical protein